MFRHDKAVEITKKLMSKKVDLDIISETTALTLEELNKIKEEVE